MTTALGDITVLEFGGLAPGPFAGMMLADFGARVIRVDREDTLDVGQWAGRGKESICLNLKVKESIDVILKLVPKIDVLIEPFRPGVMEKLGLGPETLLALNPKLIYARLTGFGQQGDWALKAGHDINYLAMSGVLSMIARSGQNPIAPINILGDFAAGSLMCVLGILLALHSRQSTGQGQVIDASIADGAAYLMTWIFNAKKTPFWNEPVGKNALDTGAHFYEVYKTKDNKYVAVGAMEPQFYAQLVQALGLSLHELPDQNDKTAWTALKQLFAAKFATKTRDEWDGVFAHLDACYTPVLTPEELVHHPFAKDRGLLVKQGKEAEMAPAPKLSATPGQVRRGNPGKNEQGLTLLTELGYDAKDIQRLQKAQAFPKAKL